MGSLAKPDRVWSLVLGEMQAQILDLGLAGPELPPREPAVPLTDNKGYFAPGASVYHHLEADA